MLKVGAFLDSLGADLEIALSISAISNNIKPLSERNLIFD